MSSILRLTDLRGARLTCSAGPRGPGRDLLLSRSFVSTPGCLCCSVSFPSGVAHDRGEEHDTGRLGLGVPEDALAGARKTAPGSPLPSPDNVTGRACGKPVGESVPSGTPSGESARISLGTPPSVMDNGWLGLLPGEPVLEPALELGLRLGGRRGARGAGGSGLVPSWQRGVTQGRGSWKRRRRRRWSRAGLVPETGRPRLRSCCRNSDT